MKNINVSLILMAVLAVAAFAVGAVAFSTEKEVPGPTVVNHTVEYVNVPVAVESPVVVEAANKILEEEALEAEALALAISKLDNDDIFDFLESENISITDEDDIQEVVVKEDEVTNVDVDEKDADVELEIRVYYENASGEDKRVDLKVELEMIDGKIKNSNIEYTLL